MANGAVDQSRRSMGGRATLLAYAISMLAYTGLGFVTQQFLTFSDALLYFVLTLEVLPRCYRYLRARR